MTAFKIISKAQVLGPVSGLPLAFSAFRTRYAFRLGFDTDTTGTHPQLLQCRRSFGVTLSLHNWDLECLVPFHRREIRSKRRQDGFRKGERCRFHFNAFNFCGRRRHVRARSLLLA